MNSRRPAAGGRSAICSGCSVFLYFHFAVCADHCFLCGLSFWRFRHGFYQYPLFGYGQKPGGQRACISLLLPSPFWKCFHFCGIIQALSKLSSGWHCCIRRCCIRSRRFSSQIKMYFSISRTAGVSISRGRGPQFLPGVGALHQLLFYQLPWVWGMTFICSIIYVCLTVRALNALAEDVENKYMLE